ncbi:hypothetical protein C816_03087 [Oscillibacter sp. 1-3]|nr:hypothetical protein C816_03087 [Oscillibacter sp. 1-3]
MEQRILGKDLAVSAVGLRCMGFSHAYGAPTNRIEAMRTILRAADLGYTFFDTAEVYGTPEDPHHNEELVGAALKGRHDVCIATKFGIRFDQTSPAVNKPLVPDSRPETIRASLEASLRRLGRDHVDLYYQHRPDPKVPVEETAGVMADLMKEGKITHWGLSEATEDVIRRAHAVCPVTAVQNRYSMMARWHEKLFPVLEELNIGFVAFSPLANGLLSGRYGKHSRFDAGTDYRSVMPQFSDSAMDQNQALLDLVLVHGGGEAGLARPDFPGLDAPQKALSRPHSRQPEARAPGGERRGGGRGADRRRGPGAGRRAGRHGDVPGVRRHKSDCVRNRRS